MIRRANVGDIEGLNRLLKQVLNVHHAGRPDIFKGDAVKYHNDELVEIINDDKRPIFVSVDENIRGKHIGSKLFNYVKEYAKNEGFYNLTLNVWALNENAQKFYEAMGLVPQKIGMETIL